MRGRITISISDPGCSTFLEEAGELGLVKTQIVRDALELFVDEKLSDIIDRLQRWIQCLKNEKQST